MEIICPECQFSRTVDESKIPARSQVATCPKCQTKFKFRELPEDGFDFTDPEPVAVPTQEPEQERTPEQQPEQEPVVPQEPVQETPPAETREESTFPPITAPGEDPKDELWDKLGDMTPPEESSQRKPPVIGSKYSTGSKTEQSEQNEQPSAENERAPIPGWTGEFSDDFPDPMQAGKKTDDGDQDSMSVPPPFEQLDRYGFFQGLYMTIKLILTSPRLFFSVMPVGGGLSKPLTFTILLTLIQSFSQYFWGLAGLSTSGAPEAESLGGVSGSAAAVLMLLFLPAFIAAGQFVMTAIYHVLLILMRADNKGFEGTFRALTYANAPIVLGIFPMPIPEIEIAWMFFAAIWGLFLTIIGLKYIHQTSFSKVIPVALIPLLLGMIAALAVFQGGLPTV